MLGVNKVTLLGRLGQNPSLNYTTDNVPVCNFSIATTEEWRDIKNGGKKHHIEWHRVVVWKKLAEVANLYLSKGDNIYIEGKLRTRSREEKGKMLYATEIHVETLRFLEKKKDGIDTLNQSLF